MTARTPAEAEDGTRLFFEGLIGDLARRSRSYAVDTSEVDEELFALFMDQIRAVTITLRKAVAGGDETELRRGAHSLLGMGGTVGVPSLSVVAEEVSAGAKFRDYERCSRLVGGLEAWADWMKGEGKKP